MNKAWGNIWRSTSQRTLLILLVLAMVLVSTVQLAPWTATSIKDGLTLGTVVSAAGTADATADGTADNVEALSLLNALPATGGRVSILTGTYVWANATTITRAIPAVTLNGTGYGTYLTAGDGVTSPITAGGNNWTISNIRVNVTEAVLLAAMGATTGWTWENVTTSDVYIAYRSDDATTAVSWKIPTGRGATYVVAASDAPAHVKAQADYIADGTADNVEIQAAIDATPNGGKVLAIGGDTGFITAATLTILGKRIEFELIGTMRPAAGVDAFQIGNAGNASDRVKIKLDYLLGPGKATAGRGIVVNRGDYAQIEFRAIRGFSTGIDIDALAGSAAEGRIYGGRLDQNTTGISFSSSALLMEGWWILASIFESDNGVTWTAAGDSIYTHFNGVVDNATVGGSTDFNDNVGHNILTPVFYRVANSTIAATTQVLSPVDDSSQLLSNWYPRAISTLTIASGAVTATRNFHNLDTEGAAGTDELDNINGGVEGQILILRVVNGSRIVTVRNKGAGTGNIRLNNGADFALSYTGYMLTLTKVGATWFEVSRSYSDNTKYRNSGSATVTNGNTTVVVNHGLSTTPTRVFITARTWSNAVKASVGTLTSTQFTITVDQDPGAGTAVFDWRAVVGEEN